MIEQFPPTLEDLYDRTLQKVLESDKVLVQLILVWLLNIKGSITVEDLQHAIAVNPETYHFESKRVPSEDHIMTMCRGLVTSEIQTRHVRLVRE